MSHYKSKIGSVQNIFNTLIGFVLYFQEKSQTKHNVLLITYFMLLISMALTDSAIYSQGISAIMSKLSEILSDSSIRSVRDFHKAPFYSFPSLPITSFPLTSLFLGGNGKKHRTSCPIFFLHFLCAVGAFEKSLLCFIWRAAFAPLLHRTVIEQQNLTIRAGLSQLPWQGTALCHSAGNWKGNEMWYLLCMSPLLHLRDHADVLVFSRKNKTKSWIMEWIGGMLVSTSRSHCS